MRRKASRQHASAYSKCFYAALPRRNTSTDPPNSASLAILTRLNTPIHLPSLRVCLLLTKCAVFHTALHRTSRAVSLLQLLQPATPIGFSLTATCSGLSCSASLCPYIRLASLTLAWASPRRSPCALSIRASRLSPLPRGSTSASCATRPPSQLVRFHPVWHGTCPTPSEHILFPTEFRFDKSSFQHLHFAPFPLQLFAVGATIANSSERWASSAVSCSAAPITVLLSISTCVLRLGSLAVDPSASRVGLRCPSFPLLFASLVFHPPPHCVTIYASALFFCAGLIPYGGVPPPPLLRHL